MNSKVLTTDKKVKYIEKPEQLQLNELKKLINNNNIINNKQ